MAIKNMMGRLARSLSRIGHPQLQQKIFFLHLPKCGGTSLIHAMRDLYQTFDPRDDRYIAHLHSGAALQASSMAGRDRVDFCRDLLPYFLGQDYRFVSGHFAFNKSAHSAFSEKYAFVTVLRHPVKKWFSLYFYNRYKQGGHDGIELDLNAFLESDLAVGYGCDYAMQFAGDGSIHDFGSQEAIDRAISNLQLFDLVGLVEELPLFINEFRRRFGHDLHLPKLRTSPLPENKQREMMTPEILNRVTQLCRPNLAIYDYVYKELIGADRMS